MPRRVNIMMDDDAWRVIEKGASRRPEPRRQRGDPFYQDYLVQLRAPLNPRGLRRSNALLWECYRYFSKQIDALEVEAGIEGEDIAKVLSETVARRLLFILITVDDELNAYTLFETLNARGLELTTTDP